MAKRKGDNTAEIMGRVSMNPMVHIDWLGTVILPISAIVFNMPLFGWAKPVPVNGRNLKKPKEDLFWIALAGPLSNVLLFVVGLVAASVFVHGGVLESVPRDQAMIYQRMIGMFLILNLFLAIFNMIPVYPLDGSKVLARFLSPQANQWLIENQATLNMVLIGLFIFGAFSILARPVYALAILGLQLVNVPPGVFL